MYRRCALTASRAPVLSKNLAQNGLPRCSVDSWNWAKPIVETVGHDAADRFPQPRHYGRACQQYLTRPRSPTAETPALNTADTGSNPVAGTCLTDPSGRSEEGPDSDPTAVAEIATVAGETVCAHVLQRDA